MTIVAAFFIWLVKDIPDQGRPVAAVRIMTGSAPAQLGREIDMFLAQSRKLVTVLAKCVRVFFKKVGERRLMRLMTGIALSLGIRGMRMLKLLGKAGMAAETGCCETVLKESSLGRSMRFMAAQTLSLENRTVDNALELFSFGLVVTGVAEVPNPLLK